MRRLASAIAVGACFIAAGACGSDGNGDKDQISGDSSGGNSTGGSDGGANQSGSGNGSSSGLFGDGGFGTGGGNLGEDAGDGGCGESPFEAAHKPVNVLIVLDKSGSMSDKPDGFSDDKWTSVQSALDTALNASKDDVAFGLDLYPVPTAMNSCAVPDGSSPTVPVDDGTTSVPTILSTLGGESPEGATPTADALSRALEYFTNGEGASRKGDKYVLLATDGGPNCNGDLDPCNADACTVNLDGDCPGEPVVPGGNCCAQDVDPDGIAKCLDTNRTVAMIEALADKGVTTFVVGIPGSEAYSDQLDAMAEAGGHAQSGATKYFAVTASGGVAGLTQVFQDITTELVHECELQLASKPPDSNKLNVDVDDMRLTRGEEGDDSDWWLDKSTDPATVVIQGPACDNIKEQGAEHISVVFGCPSFTPPK